MESIIDLPESKNKLKMKNCCVVLLLVLGFSQNVFSQTKITIPPKHEVASKYSLGDEGLLLITAPTAGSGDLGKGE